MRRRREFLRVAGRGRRAAQPGLVLQALKRPDLESEATRYGLTVTRKVGKAVTRNRVRRRLRALAESLLPALGRQGYDYVLIGRHGTIERPFAELQADMERAVRSVHSPPKSTSRDEA